MNITKELIENYIKYVCIFKIKKGFSTIASIEEVKQSTEELNLMYSSNGGVQEWLAEKLKLSLHELSILELSEALQKEQIKANYVFDNYFDNKDIIDNDFKFNKFKEFYNKYIREKTCQYCGVSEDELDEFKKKYSLNKRKNNSTEDTIINFQQENKYAKSNNSFICCVCNSLKEDTISCDEFDDIGKGISLMWQSLGLNCHFRK